MKTLLSRLASLALLAALVVPALGGCNSETALAKQARETVEQQKAADDATLLAYLNQRNITNYTRTSSGLYIINTADGSGPLIRVGNQVSVRYIGRFIGLDRVAQTDRTDEVFESTYESRANACRCGTFVVGAQILAGWTEGLQLMQLGSRKTLLIPSYLAYGPLGNQSGAVPVSPNMPLRFDMDVVAVAQ